jgi:hypothetical protein
MFHNCKGRKDFLYSSSKEEGGSCFMEILTYYSLLLSSAQSFELEKKKECWERGELILL